MRMKPLVIGDLVARIPIIQGGMGVGVSRYRLAAAVAREGGIGIISTAQIGYDVIISGADLPITLPSLVEGYNTKIAPIVSSPRAAALILKMWDRKYRRTADFVVIEGPRAGGHLGFAKEDLDNINQLDYDSEIKDIIEVIMEYEAKYRIKIPVIIAGGIFDKEDIINAMELGADGVQIATRFVATEECDASPAFKEAYLKARKEDVKIVVSPVGMPGRAIENNFLRKIALHKEKVIKCYNCLEKCNPKEIPYCITSALINAVKGNIDEGLIFCGDCVDRLDKITTVKEIFKELVF